MKNERILSHVMSQKLTEDEINGVSATGTTVATGSATYNPHSGVDGNADVTIDM